MALYGNLTNRIEENRNLLGREIRADDDLTEYHWSDRSCYFVTRVENQKHIFVKRYCVCADHEKPGIGMGHQDWLYFKSTKEMQKYTNDCVDKGLLPDYCKHPLDDIKENGECELVFRYGRWYWVARYWYDVKLEKPKYTKANITFGVRYYYYDWEF